MAGQPQGVIAPHHIVKMAAVWNDLARRTVNSQTRQALRDTALEDTDPKETILDKMRAFFQRVFNIGRVSPEWLNAPPKMAGLDKKAVRSTVDIDRLNQVKAILDAYDQYFVVVPGASVTRAKQEGIFRNLRTMLENYERSIGDDPNHDWSKQAGLSMNQLRALLGREMPFFSMDRNRGSSLANDVLERITPMGRNSRGRAWFSSGMPQSQYGRTGIMSRGSQLAGLPLGSSPEFSSDILVGAKGMGNVIPGKMIYDPLTLSIEQARALKASGAIANNARFRRLNRAYLKQNPSIPAPLSSVGATVPNPSRMESRTQSMAATSGYADTPIGAFDRSQNTLRANEERLRAWMAHRWQPSSGGWTAPRNADLPRGFRGIVDNASLGSMYNGLPTGAL